MKRRTLPVIVCLLLLAGVMGPGPMTVGAATITVNSNQDNMTSGDGLCTLREALLNANDDTDYTGNDCAAGLGADVITFASPMNIVLNTALGSLVITEQVNVNGTDRWDSVNHRPGVWLNGVDQTVTCIHIGGAAMNVEIYGLFVYGCSTAIDIRAPYNTIGSDLLGQRNVLSNNADYGVLLAGTAAHHNHIQGNWIGLSITGDTKGPNRIGVAVIAGAHDNDIGGQTAGAGNFITGNTQYGVWIDGDGCDHNRLGGNVIGLPANGSLSVGNGLFGVLIDGADYTLVGVTPMVGNIISENEGTGIHITGGSGAKVLNNTISHNQGHGVAVDGSQGNGIEMNSIHHNLGEGISLLNGANGGIAAPSISSAGPFSASGTACAGCTVRVYSDSQDEGETYQGWSLADGSGSWTYSGALAGPNLTATNTDEPDSNTSEFSLPYAIGSGTCSSPLPISCGQSVSADTSLYANNHDDYTCGWDASGPEAIYAFTLTARGNYTVTAELLSTPSGQDLDLYFLASGGCTAGQCLQAGSYGDVTATAGGIRPGTYYIAVDGFSGAAGAFDLQLTCEMAAHSDVFLPVTLRNR